MRGRAAHAPTPGHSTSAMPRNETIILSWSMKSTPVAYSVSKPTAKPNMTHRPFPISFFFVQPNTLPRADAHARSPRGDGRWQQSRAIRPVYTSCQACRCRHAGALANQGEVQHHFDTVMYCSSSCSVAHNHSLGNCGRGRQQLLAGTPAAPHVNTDLRCLCCPAAVLDLQNKAALAL